MFGLDPTGPTWIIGSTLGATVLIVCLWIDASWMWAMIRSGAGASPPPLFKSRVPLPNGWRRFLWIGGFVFGLAPFMMQGAMEVGRHLPPSARNTQMIAIGVALVVLLLAEYRRWKTVSAVGAVGVGLALLSPYALAGPSGWRAYAVVTGLMAAILGLLYLTFALHRVIFGWRPRARWVAGLRLAFDCAGIAALVCIVFWPRFAPY